MRTGLLLLAALAAALQGCASPPTPVDRPAALAEADYRLDLQAGASAPVEVVLELRFPHGTPAEVRLSFARRYAFVSPDAPLLAAAPVFTDARGRPLAAEALDPFTWRLRQPPQRFTVRYAVRLDHRDLPGVAGRDEYEQPYLRAGHGLLSTAVLLLLPELGPLACRLRLELPPGWAPTPVWPEVDGWLVPPTPLAARNDLLPVGRWESDSFEAAGFVGAVHYAPGQRLRIGASAAVLGEVARQLIDWMGAPPAPRFGFLFPQVDGRGAGGSPKSTTMSLFLGDDALPRARGFLAHLGAHEFFHLWGRKDVPAPDEMRWFEEGVTDWMAHRAALEVGGIGLEDLHRELGRARRAVAAAAGSGLSLAEAGGPAFFEGGDAYQLCYSGGLLVGTWMDRELTRAGAGGLIAFLREWKRAGGPGTEAPLPGLERLLDSFAARAGGSAAAELRALLTAPFGADQADACTSAGPLPPQ